MCGICGIAHADPSQPVDLATLRRMRRSIDHRGPDGHGAEHWPGVGFAHARLSIIDVAGGRQPLSNEDGTVWVTFNGEIYNYRELTRELERLGHRFHTHSDTEVLVHAYEEYGLDFARRLNGIFALALYDVRLRRVVLARDQVGVKPLFYSVTPRGLFFGSEIKAVLAGTGAAPAIREGALDEYLTFRYVAGAASFFEGVHRLPPAHLGVWENGSLALHRFWALPHPPEVRTGTVDDLADELGRRLEGALEGQMMSEVPLGTFCSGGVDSGLITGYAAAKSPHRLLTFSVGFQDPRWDETPLAADTSSRFGTDHRIVVARPDDFDRHLLPLIGVFDEPLNHPNSLPIHLLSRFARQQVTVVLTGEGSDEVFGGYPRYHIARLRGALGHAPDWLRGALAGAAGRVPGHRARLLGELLGLPLADSMLLNSRYVSPALVRRLLRSPSPDAFAERHRLWEEAYVPGDPVASISRFELTTYLGSLLDRVDRMSMAVGLEARVPFLDIPLLEWSTSLPTSAKLRGRRNKVVVKRLAERMLSPRVTRGPKSGFGVPLGAWFRGHAFASLVRRLRDRDHPAAEHFDRRTLASLLDKHMAGSADHGQALWLVSNVYLWYEAHLMGLPAVEQGGALVPA